MGLTFPRQPVVEVYLDGWRDVSLDVRQKPAISITQGRKDWAAKVSPSRCTFALDDGPDHGDGDYDPYNPLGQWFDYLNRNTPARVGLSVVNDTFARTVSNGWGATPTGEVWDNNGSGGTIAASNWNVAGGVGSHSVPVASAFRRSVIPVSLRDVEVTATVSIAITDITGGDLEPCNLVCRWLDSTTFYMARVVMTSAESLTVSIHHSTAGQLVAPVTVAALNPATNKNITVKFQAEGQTLRAKAYAVGAEPLGWQVEVHDTRITGPGAVGVRNGVATGNSNSKPVVFNIDNFTVRIPRFAGELVMMQPQTTVDHADRTTAVEAAGIRRRLAKGEKPLGSAFRRYAEHQDVFVVTDMWALDEPSTSVAPGVNLIAGHAPAVFTQNSGLGTVKWGETNDPLPAVPAYVSLNNFGQLDLPVDPSALASAWSASWAMRISPNTGGQINFGSAGSPFRWVLVFYTDATFELYFNPLGTPSTTGTLPVPRGLEKTWITMGLTVTNGGGTTMGFHINLDGETLGIGSVTTAGAYAPLNLISLASADAVDGVGVNDDSFSSVLVTPTPLSNLIDGKSAGTWAAELTRGWPGEHAGDRFARLCAEEGVSATIVGTPSATPAMGPQTPTPLMKLLDECIAVDQGSAFDPRGTTGLGMRTHRATTALDPVLALDYADGHVAPDFGPITDDQPVLNDVTAKRPNGGEYRAQRLAGPNNVEDPGTAPGAAGRADTTVTTNVATDLNLPDQAGWRVHMGTVDSPRYPTVTVDLAQADVAGDQALTSAVLGVGVDDHLDITGATVRRIFDDVRLVARGYTETIGDAFQHRIVFNSEPYAPLDVAVYGDTDDRYDTAGTALSGTLSPGATSFTVNVTAGQPWTQTAARFPLHIWVGGERIRLSAIAAPSSATPPLTQVFTVDTGGRAVNGVSKGHAAGTAVRLFKPVYRGH